MRRNVSESIAVMLETRDVSLLELVDARISLEVPVAGLAAQHATDGVAAALLAAIGEAEGNHPASEAFRVADARFHRVIATAARNRVLRAFTSWTLDVLQPSLIDTIGASVDGAAILDQHRAIQRAIRLRQPAAAQRAMRRHLEYLSELVRSLDTATPMGEP
jgi:GntR family transcriptional regulator, transcriptional repressor for pyruvate dehydrogenase complex